MLQVTGLVVGCVSLLFYVIGIAIPYWLYFSQAGVTVHIGLWQICTSTEDFSQCRTITDEVTDASLKATRAMEIIAMLFLAAAVVCYIIKLCCMKQKNVLPKIGAALGFVSGTLAIIGCVICGAKVKPDNNLDAYKLHAGFALCIVGAIGSYISSVLFVLTRDA